MTARLEESPRPGPSPCSLTVRNPEAEGPPPAAEMDLTETHRALQEAQRGYYLAKLSKDYAQILPALVVLNHARFEFYAARGVLTRLQPGGAG